MRKKRIGFISSSPLVKTGFSHSIKTLLSYLYKTNKYEIYLLHQGMMDGHPDFQRFPYKSTGALTQEIVNSEQWHKDQNFQRTASYGNFQAKDFIIKNELDNIYLVEDVWAFPSETYWKQDYFDFCKKNVVLHTTCDSLPVLPQFKEWAEHCPNIYFWTKFGCEALWEEDYEKYKHVNVLHGIAKTESFKPLPAPERKELRKKFGIKENDFLGLYSFRNQTRKSAYVIIEALAKLKKQNPEKNVKLHFHTSWTEQSGWNLDQLRKEAGLQKEDILATYFCQKCGDWNIQPFEGEPLDCEHCKTEKSRITAGITSSITEDDLSKIFSLSDVGLSVFNSGGLEYFNVEGLLCGLPMLISDYSCGKEFTEQDFVYPLDGYMRREPGTNFLKHEGNPNTIVKFINKMYDAPIEKRREIGLIGRKWALKEFSVETVGSIIEKQINDSEYLDWSKYHESKKDYDVKNTDAVIPNGIESDKEYIKVLYKNILKMDVKDDDSGLLQWESNFTNVPEGNNEQRQQIRQKIEQSFRKIAFDENQKNNPTNIKDLIDFDRPNKRGIIVIKESLGDCIVVSSLLKSFHEKYEGYDLYLSTQPQFFEVFEGNPYIHKIIPYHSMMENEMGMIGCGGEEKDALFNFFGFPAIATQKILNYLSHNKSGDII